MSAFLLYSIYIGNGCTVDRSYRELSEAKYKCWLAGNVQGISWCRHTLRVRDKEFISTRYGSKPKWVKVFISAVIF